MSHTQVTRGQCEAVFNTAGNGGQMIIAHHRTDNGRPSPDSLTAAIRAAGPDSPWNDAHFCQEDWHVLLQGNIEGGDASFKQQDAAQILDAQTIVLTLDGNQLQTERKPNKPFLHPETRDPAWVNAWYFQVGQLFSPNTLSVGKHQLDMSLTGPAGLVYQQTTTFYIDAPGTGKCA